MNHIIHRRLTLTPRTANIPVQVLLVGITIVGRVPEGEGASFRMHLTGKVFETPCKSYMSKLYQTSYSATRGRNVCLFFLTGMCTFDAQCRYSHEKKYLHEDGWWNNPSVAEKCQETIIQDSMAGIDLSSRFMATFGVSPEFLHNISRQNHRLAVPQPLSDTTRFILFLRLVANRDISDFHDDVRTAMEAKIKVIEVNAQELALSRLQCSGLQGVYIMDAGILERKFSRLSSEVVNYVKGKRRGTVVFAPGFGSTVLHRPEMALYFAKEWGLSWRAGSTGRSIFARCSNKSSHFNDMPSTCSMKVLNLDGVPLSAAIYLSTELLWSIPGLPAAHPAELAIFYHRLSNKQGWLGYVGNLNGESEGTMATLAMFGFGSEIGDLRKQ